MRKWFFLILFFILASFSYSQEDAQASINYISFKDNLIYSSGSGISVHFDPKGIYKLGVESNLGTNDANNNAFILELSEEGGSFQNPTQLETLYDFYTPLINSNLPSNLTPGTYRLRIRATLGYDGDPNGWSLESNDYSEVVYEFDEFEVQNQNINSEISITSSFPSNDNYINCLNDSDLTSPFIGSMSQSIGSTTAIVSTVNYLQFNISGYDNDNTYEITLYDYYNDSNQVLNQGAGPGFYEIPDNLEIGTYTIEVVETLPNDISNVISFSFLWHSNATALNNQTSESVCVGEDVIFSIPTNDDGIARNYFGSYYKIDFGDGSNIILTHNAILHQNSFFHKFEGASCNIEGSNLYEIEESLYNKYEDCDSYTVNGEGAVKFVDASAPPAPQFNINQQQCINPLAPENVEVINTTQTGEWTTENSPDCQTDLISYWSVRPPGFDDFVSVNDFYPTWITDLNDDGLSDLDIPYSEIDDPGCWDFELVAINGNNVICSSTVVASGTIDMLELPLPSFILQDEEGNEVSQICPGEIVNIIDTSNLSDVEQEDCQSVTYDWTISGAQYVNGTGTNSQNPSVIFNNPGIYEIHLSLDNGICPSVNFNVPDFIVQGTPSVSLNDANNGSNEVVCSDSLPYIIDFNSTFTPAYSTDPYTPTAFLWEISGDNDDYTFINSTDSGSPYPIVQFNSFGCYTISNTVNGDCDNASNDSFILSLTATPDVDFDFQDSNGNEVNQVCPGDVISLIDNSTVDGSGCQDVQYSWSINGTTNYNYETGNSSSQNPSISFSDPGSYEITLQVNNGSCATDTLTQTINIEGTPSVNINAVGGDSEQICMDSSDIPYVIDFSSSYTPEYSDGVFTPANYSWEISGDDISASDYSFINSSSSSSIYPTIQFNSFGCYTITNTVTGNCGTSSSDSFTISLDQNPVANFEILNTLGQVVDQICPGDIVQLHDLSDVSADGCDPVEYQWGISALIPGTPAGHCVPAQASTWTDPSPYIEFNEPGIFEVSVQVTLGNCPVSIISQEIVVEGPPTVDINVNGPDSDQICLLDSELPYQINFANTYTPEYSDSVYTPSSYLWVISGDGVTADDYTFINSSTSELPIIQFNSFKDFTITTTVGGNCDVMASDEFQISFNQIPELSNNNMSQIVCSGESTEEIIFDSNVAETNYSWSFTSSDTYLSGYVQQGIGNFSVQNIINSNNISGQVEFSVTPSTSDCEGTPQTFTITVNPEPSIDNIEQEVCTGSGISITPTDGTIPSGTTYLWDAPTSSPSGVITGGNSGTDETTITESELLNSTNSPAVLTYSVTPTTPDGCTGDPFTVSVTVNPLGQVDNPGDQEFCNNDNISINFTTDNTGGDTTYSWTNTNSAIGLSNSGSGNINVTATNTTNDAITSTVTVTPSFEGCEGTPQTFTITVNPEPSIDNIEQEVCTGSGISITPTDGTIPSGTTYLWDAPTSSPSGVITGGNSGTDETTITESELLNSTNSPAVLTYSVTPTTPDGCTGDPFTVSVTVNPLGQVDNPGDQEFCNNDNISINFTTDNTGGDTTYSWTNTNSAIGLSNSGSGNINVTATNTTNDAITSTVTVTPSFEGCEGTPQTFTITVNPAPQLDEPNDQVIFTGESTTAVALTSSVNGVTYSWSANEPTGNLIGLSQSSGTSNQIPSETLVNDTSGPLVLTYTITPVLEGVDCDADLEEYTITINPPVTMLSIDDQVVCNGDDVNVDFESANSGGSTTFEWTNDTPGIGLADSGFGDLPTFTAINSGLSPIVATVTVTPTFENGGISSEGDSQTFTITVNPSSQVDEVDSQILCNADETAAIAFSTENTGGTTTYSWVNDTPSIGLAATGSGDIASFTAVNNSTSPVTATITATPIYTNEGISCDGPEETFTITVNPTAQVDDSQDQIICNGETTSVEFTTQNTGGTTTYAWTNDTPSIGLADLGTGNIASFAGVNEGTSPVVATLTVTPTFTENGISCTGPEETFTITVNPTGQLDAVDSQILCNADETAAIAFSTENTGGTTTYAWTNDTPSIGLASSGNGDIGSFNVVNNGNEPVTATVVVTPSFEGCNGPTETFTITVNPTAEMNDPEDMVVCNAEVTDAVEFTTDNTGGTTTYTWINDTPAIGLAATGSGDLPSFTAINTGTEPIVATVEVTPLFTDDINCDGISQTFTITVNPSAQVDEPNDLIICDGQTTSITYTTQNTGGTTSYSWVNDTPGIGLASSGNGNIESLTVSNSGNTPVVATVIVTPTFENEGVACQGDSQTFTITVNPSSQVDEVDSQILCNADETAAIAFSTENTGGTTTYSWVNDTPSIGLAATGSGDIASFTAVNNSTSPVTATITATPIYTNEGISCDGPEETFTITVNPTAQVDDSQDQIICNGETTSVEFTTQNTGGTTTYAWTNDTPSIGLADLGTGNIASFAGVNEGTSPVVATLTVTPTFTENGISCTGPEETFTITVNPTGQLDAVDSQILCNADETAAIAFSTENTGGTTTYAWTNDTPSIGLASSGNGDIGSFNVVNNGNEPVTATVVVTPSFEGCNGPTETFTITVNPTAEMNDPEDMVVCNAEVTDAVEFTTDNTGGTTTYTWINDTPAIGLAATGSGDLPSFTAINTGTEPIVATVEVTPLFTDDINCDGISQTFTITVNPSAQVDEPNDQVLCNGDSILVEFTTQNTIGNTTYAWTSDLDFGNGLAGSGNIDFNVVNNGTFPAVATVTVIPIIENLGVSCSGPIQTFTVSVNGNVDDQEDISNYNGFEISCYEANDGYINLNPIGGTPSQAGSEYIYSWTGPNGFTSSEQNISELAPGTYIVNIIDSLDCSFEFEYEINEPDPLEIIVDEQSDVQCNGIFDGIISISPQGGAAPYTYEWTKDGVFFSSEQNIDNLEPGTYVVFLNDANLCGPVSQIFEIVQPEPIEISLVNSVDILCFGENTGSIDINVIGGTPEQISTEVTQYNYLWIGPNGYTSNEQDIDNLFAGIYTVTVSDSLGCEEIFEVELTQPDDLIINYTTTDNSCYESDDGTITLDIQGGVEPYQIFWSNFGNGPTQTNLSAGIYEVTVIDAHDCEEVVNIEIIEAPIFDTNPVQTNISCFGETDGSINLNITGGIAPIFVSWDDDPSAGEDRNNLGPGTYNVLIEDSSGNNCTISHEFIIVEPQELILNAVVTNPLDCDNVNSGSIDLQVVGGTEPYTFLWSNGAVTEDLNDIPAGNYSVSVTDFMGCEVLDQFELIRPSDLETNLIIDFTADCENGIPSQITTLEVSGGVPPYNIVWSDGDVSGDIGEIMTTSQNGTYVIDITDSLGCTDQILFDVDLFELGSPGFTYDSNGLILCDSIGVNDLVQFTNTSTGDYTNLIWNFGDGTPIVEGVENPEHTYLYEGTYEITLIVEYPYGCSYTFSETIGVTEGYGLVLPNTFTPNGDGINDTIRPWYKCMSSIEVSIYDTFGSLLYVESSTGEIYGWDGLINGRPAENGNYIIVVRAVSLYGQEIELNGPVTLVR